MTTKIRAEQIEGGTDSNLDADLLDGLSSEEFAPASHQHAGEDITSAVANATDADTVDGQHASSFAADGHDHDSEYADIEHGHAMADISDLPAVTESPTEGAIPVAGEGGVLAEGWLPSLDFVPNPAAPAPGDVIQHDGEAWIASSAMSAPDAPVVTSAAGSGGIVTVTASQSPAEYVDGWELVHDPSEATDPDTLSPVFSRTGRFEFPAKESLYIWVRAALGTARSAWTALPLYSVEYNEDPINGVNGADVPGMSALGIAKKLVYSTASPAPPGEAVYLQSADHMAKTFSMWTVASGIAATEFGCRITTKLHWMNDTGHVGRLTGFVCGADSTIFSSFSTATFYAVWLHQVGASTVYIYFSKFVGATETNIWTSSNIWTTASIQSNDWNDVIFTRNGANFTLSVNGVEVMNQTNSDIPASSSRIHLGLVHATNSTQIVFGESILVESRNSTTSAIAPGKVADADLLDGNEASAFAAASHTHAGTDVTSAVANATDADTVDGQHASSFAADGHDHDSEYADIEHDHDSDYAAISSEVKFTAIGGVAVKAKADEALNKGEVVAFYQTGGALDVRKVPTSGDMQSMPAGVVLENANDQADVWVVFAGYAETLPESGVTAAIGNVAYTSGSEAGRAAQSSSVPTTEHWREIGHWAETGSGNGALARLLLHFN